LLQTARAGRRAERRAAEELTARLWPKLFAWHRWLVTHRDPAGSGLLSVVHSWESGMDNSARWDTPYRAVRPTAALPPFTRLDRDLVADGAQRPSDLEYRRYLWLIEQLRAVRYDADDVVRTSSFLVADVFFTAIFVAASEVLTELGEQTGQPPEQLELLRGWARRGAGALPETVAAEYGLARDRDLRTGGWLATRTIAGFAPLLCGGLSPADEHAMLAVLDGPQWAGHPGLFSRVPPSTSPRDPGFRTREYWRGPVWPVITWLFWWAFRRRGWDDRAATLRAESLRQLGDGTFAEYYHPFTGEPLGSRHQSWTAAVTLDWLANP
ncbi:MAG: MGH1-like glycoside hydrolase domain-containing protein, partial [Thermocrispum sp.]